MILQAFLLGCIAFIGKCDLATGTNMIQRPIVLGPFVGLVLGDPELGIKIGATLELAFLGQVSVGAYIPPNVIVGGVLGTAFAITTGKGAEIAFTMAFPIALLAQSIDNVMFSLVRPMFGKLADKYAAQGNTKAVGTIHLCTGFLTCFVLFLLTFLGFVLSAYFGIPVVGIAIIGVIAVFIKINFHEEETLAVQGGLDEDDDF